MRLVRSAEDPRAGNCKQHGGGRHDGDVEGQRPADEAGGPRYLHQRLLNVPGDRNHGFGTERSLQRCVAYGRRSLHRRPFLRSGEGSVFRLRSILGICLGPAERRHVRSFLPRQYIWNTGRIQEVSRSGPDKSPAERASSVFWAGVDRRPDRKSNTAAAPHIARLLMLDSPRRYAKNALPSTALRNRGYWEFRPATPSLNCMGRVEGSAWVSARRG